MGLPADYYEGRTYVLLRLTRFVLFACSFIFLMLSIIVLLMSLDPPKIIITWIGANISLPPKYFISFGILIGIISVFSAGAGEMISIRIDMAKDLYYTANKLDQIASHLQDSLDKIQNIADLFDEKDNIHNSEIPKWSP